MLIRRCDKSSSPSDSSPTQNNAFVVSGTSAALIRKTSSQFKTKLNLNNYTDSADWEGKCSASDTELHCTGIRRPLKSLNRKSHF